ncbi:type II toxin-antitoxin system RelE family toxin [Salinisphaera hydrothermalis]|uniref:type II toxin-antitoxin system RelE family toxin n=1 Tax=Salinisphaera hydrothermalis TaxID=563188 RepID=UPI00333F7732
MAWRIELTETARKALEKLDRQAARRISTYLRERVATADEPRHLAKSLQGELREYWRFRVGDYRIVCDIQDDVLRVLVVRIAHRKHVYRR